jgi:hypothetical protein
MRHNRALNLYDESNKLVNYINNPERNHRRPDDTGSHDDLTTVELSQFSEADANNQAQYLVLVCDWLDQTIRKNNSREVHKRLDFMFIILKIELIPFSPHVRL